MKMLASAAFYTLSGNSPAVFLIYFWHSCYISSTFEVHSRYSSCILFEFLDAQTVFGSHSASILSAFIQHSRHLPAGIIRAAFELQSYSIRLAFWTFWQHSKYSYWVRSTFESHSRVNLVGMCKNHSMYVRGEFRVFEQHSLKNYFFYDDLARMWLEFSKFFIPADSGSFRLRVTGALGI